MCKTSERAKSPVLKVLPYDVKKRKLCVFHPENIIGSGSKPTATAPDWALKTKTLRLKHFNISR